ncbi:MAG: glycosyltransferase family 2 protein [Endomicrobium sp.]|jgi:glycosyltransferase involved in cell wall biosynthesis|uniref:glycosyltransferase family A protein n=1 Tax=Candidatus Endomicrobiellum cubanum TaxID=3242325 RepID=UPI00282ABFC5|nr:glycosyltransferase family 2 protein [Endomicrobium sp.]
MKLMIAVPVYNRKKYLNTIVKSLKECDCINEASIIVFNDCSTEFDETYLKQIFKELNANVVTRLRNLRADRNNYKIMLDFLNTNNDVLFICDSDLLLRPDTLKFIQSDFERTDGFLSVYNSDFHRDVYFDGEFVYKQDVGFAGICLSRDLVKSFVLKQKETPRSMDFKLSSFLIKKGIRLMVPKNSYVQHIGFDGQNCNNKSVDFSSNFVPLSSFNKEIIDEIMPIVLKRQAEMIQYLLFKDKYKRCGFMVHQPRKYFAQNMLFKKLEKIYSTSYPINDKEKRYL